GDRAVRAGGPAALRDRRRAARAAAHRRLAPAPGPREAAAPAHAVGLFRPGRAADVPEGESMSFDDLSQAAWLARARAQSLRLAETRARQPRSWRPPAHRLHASPIRWAMAGALALLLIASGAWALVARGKKS